MGKTLTPVEAITLNVDLSSFRIYCYMLIQILQNKGQLLTNGARAIAGGLGRVEQPIYSL
jgi:hypothetical protein